MFKNKAVEMWDISHDLNCAETILYAANDFYALNLSKDTLKAMSSFGGGFAIGETCGAAAGAVAVIGIMFTETRGHQSPKTRELTKLFMNKFYDKLGTYKCTELKERYKYNDSRRCLIMIETAADILEEVIKLGKEN